MASIFNSNEDGYANINVVLAGRPITGLRGVKYKITQEKEVIHASGNEPHGVGRGNKTYEGEIVVLQSELEALTRAAGVGKNITDLRNLDIVVAYAAEEGLPLVTDIIKYAEFTESEKGMSQGDKFSEHTLPFIALGIEFNA